MYRIWLRYMVLSSDYYLSLPCEVDVFKLIISDIVVIVENYVFVFDELLVEVVC